MIVRVYSDAFKRYQGRVCVAYDKCNTCHVRFKCYTNSGLSHNEWYYRHYPKDVYLLYGYKI